MKLNWLTNSDSNLQSKMRYFADYFLFANEYLGRLPRLPFDNPLSLVNKIIFQLENNIERAPRYFENHYNQLNQQFAEFLKKNYSEFHIVDGHFSVYSQCVTKEKKRVAWLKDHPEFLNSLRGLESILEKDLFEKMFLWLLQYIQCSHKLNTHKKEVEFCTHVLVSLFRLAGHSKKEVETYITKILSKEKGEFPFPLKVYKHDKAESFKDLAEDHLRNRDFKKQFEGFKNLMINREKRVGYFFFAIDHVIIARNEQRDLQFQVDKATFISPRHDLLKNLRGSIRRCDRKNFTKMYPLFFGKNKLLAYVEIPFVDKDYAKIQASKIIDEELMLLNKYINCKMELQDKHFIFTEELGSEHWSGNRSFKKFSLNYLEGNKLDDVENHPFALLRNHNFSGKEHFLHNEKTFIKAAHERNLSLFWQYIENLYWFQNTENEDIRRKFVSLLMKNVSQFNDFFLLNIGHLFSRLDVSEFSMEISTNDKVIEKINSELVYKHNVKFPLGSYKTKIKHPFLKSLITLYVETKSREHLKKWQDHFSAIILELQEYRNAKLHSGYVNKYSRIKLEDVVPEIMSRARLGIARACIRNKKFSFNELMERLST